MSRRKKNRHRRAALNQSAAYKSPGRTVRQDGGLAGLFGIGQGTHSGVSVDHLNVMALPAVMRTVNILANGVAKVPFYVFRQDGQTQTWDTDHPSWDVISRKPNKDFTAGVFRKTMTAWALLYGNAVALISRPNWPNSGEGMELIPLLPDRTFPVRISEQMAVKYPEVTDRIGDLYYETTIDGQVRSFAAADCLHIRGLGPNPFWGWDVVDVLRQSFGGAMAAQEFGHRFFGQGANPAGFVEMPSGMDEEAEERFVQSLRRGSEGMGKSHRLMVLEEGAKFHQWTMDPEKSQFLEGKQFDVRTIAMALGIKVHKLIDSANSSFKSLEQANQEHKDDDLLPWIETWKEEMSDKLLTVEQSRNRTHTVDVDDEYLEWSPFADRAEGCVKLYHGGLIEKDEGRRRLNFGPSKSPNAGRFLKPLNHAWEDEAIDQTRPTAPTPPEDVDDDAEDDAGDELATWQAKAEAVTVAYVDRIALKLCKESSERSRKGGTVLCEWIDSLQAEEGPHEIQEDINEMFENFRSVVNSILNVTQESKLEDTLSATLSQWRETRTKERVVA